MMLAFVNNIYFLGRRHQITSVSGKFQPNRLEIAFYPFNDAHGVAIPAGL
jgi:hypothetical protein